MWRRGPGALVAVLAGCVALGACTGPAAAPPPPAAWVQVGTPGGTTNTTVYSTCYGPVRIFTSNERGALAVVDTAPWSAGTVGKC
jgi:hypothetical protein